MSDNAQFAARLWAALGDRPMRTTTTVPCACGCGTPVQTPNRWGHRVRYVAGHSGRAATGPAHIICQDCGQAAPLEGRGRCRRCYNAAHRAGVFTPVPQAQRRVVESESRLPIPPMVRCGGCADVPRCDRAARADVGYCWRCQQARAQAVAA